MSGAMHDVGLSEALDGLHSWQDGALIRRADVEQLLQEVLGLRSPIVPREDVVRRLRAVLTIAAVDTALAGQVARAEAAEAAISRAMQVYHRAIREGRTVQPTLLRDVLAPDGETALRAALADRPAGGEPS